MVQRGFIWCQVQSVFWAARMYALGAIPEIFIAEDSTMVLRIIALQPLPRLWIMGMI